MRNGSAVFLPIDRTQYTESHGVDSMVLLVTVQSWTSNTDLGRCPAKVSTKSSRHDSICATLVVNCFALWWLHEVQPQAATIRCIVRVVDIFDDSLRPKTGFLSTQLPLLCILSLFIHRTVLHNRNIPIKNAWVLQGSIYQINFRQISSRWWSENNSQCPIAKTWRPETSPNKKLRCMKLFWFCTSWTAVRVTLILYTMTQRHKPIVSSSVRSYKIPTSAAFSSCTIHIPYCLLSESVMMCLALIPDTTGSTVHNAPYDISSFAEMGSHTHAHSHVAPIFDIPHFDQALFRFTTRLWKIYQ